MARRPYRIAVSFIAAWLCRHRACCGGALFDHIRRCVRREPGSEPQTCANRAEDLPAEDRLGIRGRRLLSLQGKPDEALGGGLLGIDRVILRPGESRTLRYPGNVEARAVGVVAEYRSLEQNRWKVTVALPQPKQLNFYRFWQTSPSEMKVTIAVKSGGLVIGNDKRGGS